MQKAFILCRPFFYKYWLMNLAVYSVFSILYSIRGLFPLFVSGSRSHVKRNSEFANVPKCLTCLRDFVFYVPSCLFDYTPRDEIHVHLSKNSSSEQCFYVRAEQAEKTDFLKYFTKDWIQY